LSFAQGLAADGLLCYNSSAVGAAAVPVIASGCGKAPRLFIRFRLADIIPPMCACRKANYGERHTLGASSWKA